MKIARISATWLVAIIVFTIYAKINDWKIASVAIVALTLTQVFTLGILLHLVISKKESQIFEETSKNKTANEKSVIKYSYNTLGQFTGFCFKTNIDGSRVETEHDSGGRLLLINQFRNIESNDTLKKKFYPLLQANQSTIDSVLDQRNTLSEIESDIITHRNLHESQRTKYIKERFVDKMIRKRKEGGNINSMYDNRYVRGRKVS